MIKDYSRFLAKAAEQMQESGIRKMGTVLVQVPGVISFAPGYPAPDVFPWDEFREASDRLLAGRDSSLLQYGPTRGERTLLEAVREILGSRGIAAKLDDLLITTGSQQALDLLGRVLLDPGDVALVELPAYTGAITAFRNTRAELVGVHQQDDGIDVNDLAFVVTRERARGRRVRFLYVVPNFQNPTGRLMSAEKRLSLLEYASKQDLLIVEDDPYGDLYFEDAASAADTRPIKADDAEGRVVYLSSFSKTLAPGFRVGWIAAPTPLTAKFELAKQAADLCTAGFDQHVVLECIRRGVLERQAPRLRAHYQEKRDEMTRALNEHFKGLIQWPVPRGGFFLWATLPEPLSADALLPRAIAHRVIYVAGSAFFVDGGGRRAVRLCFAAPQLEQIEEGVRRLASAVKEELATVATVRSAI